MNAGVTVIEAPRGVADLGPEEREHFFSSRHIEFLGGLGDVINRCHQCDWYVSLSEMKPGDRATVFYLSHNSAGLSLFRWIKTEGTVLVLNVGFSARWNDPAWRMERGLPRVDLYPYDIRRIDYYPSAADATELASLYRLGPYIAFVCSAGTPERTIPESLREAAATIALAVGLKVVTLGGNYARNSSDPTIAGIKREEVHLSARYGVVDMIDRLSVPGSIKAIERAAAVFTAHTALCLASWYVRQPTFLLYNEFVQTNYVPRGPHGYLFGMSRPGNDHMEFSQYEGRRLSRFLSNVL